MSRRKALWASGLVAGILLTPATLKAQGNYLDVFIAKVKPEKTAEAEGLARKIADINRRNAGDHVVTMETVYGEMGTYVFVTERQAYADVDKGNDAFMSALNKSLGKQAADKLMADFSNCLISGRSELRRRRLDLSRKMPSDPESFAKLVGTARVLRTTVVHVRPGHVLEFEEYLKEAKEKGDRNADAHPLSVSQAVEGTQGGTFYLTSFRTSLGGFDNNPTLREIVGDELFTKLQKLSVDSFDATESAIYRFRPDMSYPPDAIAQASADFWNPKPVVAAAKPKAKTSSGAEVTPASAKATDKPQK